jgi:hypothetical protein
MQKSQIDKQMVFPEGKLGEVIMERFQDTNWARMMEYCGRLSEVPTVSRQLLDCDGNGGRGWFPFSGDPIDEAGVKKFILDPPLGCLPIEEVIADIEVGISCTLECCSIMHPGS